MEKHNKDQERKWLAGFNDFVSTPSQRVPDEISRRIFAAVKKDLQPGFGIVLVKGFAIHTIAAALSLLVCPQFGIGPIGGGHGLMVLFMPFGSSLCAAFCGAVILGWSSLVTAFVLRREELRVANSFGFAYIPLIVALSFAALMLAGGFATLEMFAYWSIGSVVAGWLFLKAGSLFRYKLLSTSLSR